MKLPLIPSKTRVFCHSERCEEMTNNNANFPMPYTVQPGMTMDYSAGDWRNNSFALPRSNASQLSNAPQPCRQHDAYVANHELCENTKTLGKLAGGFGGGYVAAQRAALPCLALSPVPAGVCFGAAFATGVTMGAATGNIAARNSSSCQYIVNGAGDCVDASHNHRYRLQTIV